VDLPFRYTGSDTLVVSAASGCSRPDKGCSHENPHKAVPPCSVQISAQISMADEIASLAANDTWTLEEAPPGVRAIPVKWVFKTKRNVDGNVERYKARLVAKGFRQLEGVDSPRSSLRSASTPPCERCWRAWRTTTSSYTSLTSRPPSSTASWRRRCSWRVLT